LRRHAFNRFDAPTIAAHREHDAGWHRFAVDQDGTRATLAAIAASLYASEMRDFAQIVDE
jgi:hypothetical protein